MMWSLRSVGDNKNVLSDIKKQAEENANELKDVRKRKEEFVRKRRDADANVREKNEEMHRLEQKIRE
jgi:peptidoglycan hydrolase CwlO-like protein